MIFTTRNIFSRNGTEDKSESTVVTRSESANNGDDMHADNQFQMTEESRKRSWLGYIKTREFWIALVLGYFIQSSTL